MKRPSSLLVTLTTLATTAFAPLGCSSASAPEDDAASQAVVSAPPVTAEQRANAENLGPYYVFWKHGDPAYARNDVLWVAYNQLGRHPNSPEYRNIFHNNGQEWCSEFASFVYWQSGVPFTGGGKTLGLSNADWLLETTGEIVSYFNDRSEFVRREALQGATPHMGDYAYVEGANFKHSTIVVGVRKETDGSETLLTIEGNHRGAPVSIFAYPRWRDGKTQESHIVGIGFRRELAPNPLSFDLTSHWFSGATIVR